MNLSNINHDATTGISSIHEIELSCIVPNANQVRKTFDPIALEELSQSIKKHGLLEPIVVSDIGDELYIIIAGERRFRASKLAGLETIKATIDSVDFENNNIEVREKSLVENIQREDLTDWEIALEIDKLWESGNYESKKELAKSIGKSQSYISKCFGVLKKLDGYILREFKKDGTKIGLSVLEELSRLPEENQVRAYKDYISGYITRSELKDYKEQNYDDADMTPSQEEALAKEKDMCWEKESEISPVKKKPIKVWVITKGAIDDDGFSAERIIDLSNYLGADPMPEQFTKYDGSKKYKITIEEL